MEAVNKRRMKSEEKAEQFLPVCRGEVERFNERREQKLFDRVSTGVLKIQQQQRSSHPPYSPHVLHLLKNFGDKAKIFSAKTNKKQLKKTQNI